MVTARPLIYTSVLFTVIGLFAVVSESTESPGQSRNNYHGAPPVCTHIFGVPNEGDCRDAIGKIPSRDLQGYLLQEYETEAFWGPRSMINRQQNRLPMYFKSGNCVVGLFLRPWGYSDASWRSIRLAAENIVDTCVLTGGYTIVGSSPYITLVVFESRGEIPPSPDWALTAIKELEAEQQSYRGLRHSYPMWIPSGRSSSEQSYYGDSNSCDYDRYCSNQRSCGGGGCNCVLQQKESIDPLTFGARRRRKLVGLCGSISGIAGSTADGLRRRSLGGEMTADIQCLCNATFAHTDCCLEEKATQTVLES